MCTPKKRWIVALGLVTGVTGFATPGLSGPFLMPGTQMKVGDWYHANGVANSTMKMTLDTDGFLKIYSGNNQLWSAESNTNINVTYSIDQTLQNADKTSLLFCVDPDGHVGLKGVFPNHPVPQWIWNFSTPVPGSKLSLNEGGELIYSTPFPGYFIDLRLGHQFINGTLQLPPPPPPPPAPPAQPNDGWGF